MNTAWLMLLIAGLLEIGWSIGLKYTDGFNFRGRPLACTVTLAAMVASMYLLSLAVRTIPIGTGYAIWTGIGALGAAILGMILFREPATAARIGCVLLIVAGIIGLKLTSAGAAAATPGGLTMTIYVGGYSKGIYRVDLNPADGSLSTPSLAVKAASPSFLAKHPTLPMAYACFEVSPDGMVASFKMDEDGGLSPRNSKSSAGNGPCHVSVDPTGRWLFAANYGDGKVAAFPIANDGAIERATFVEQGNGSSVVRGRQDGPHAHEFIADPSGRFAVSTDLGTDEIVPYKIVDGVITALPAFTVTPGSGPRHVAFGKDAKFLYVCAELENKLLTLAWDASAGSLTLLDTQSTLPADFKGQSSCAEVAVHPSGRFVYVSNRGHDSLAVFAIDQATGWPSLVGHVATGGSGPRHFAIDSTGQVLVVANQKSNLLTSFRIDPATGMPSSTGFKAEIEKPSCILFAR